MQIIHHAWCTLRSCTAYLHEDDLSVSYWHAEPSPTQRPAAQREADVSLFRTLVDGRSEWPSTGDTVVTLKISEPGRAVDVDLSATDARLLARSSCAWPTPHAGGIT